MEEWLQVTDYYHKQPPGPGTCWSLMKILQALRRHGSIAAQVGNRRKRIDALQLEVQINDADYERDNATRYMTEKIKQRIGKASKEIQILMEQMENVLETDAKALKLRFDWFTHLEDLYETHSWLATTENTVMRQVSRSNRDSDVAWAMLKQHESLEHYFVNMQASKVKRISAKTAEFRHVMATRITQLELQLARAQKEKKKSDDSAALTRRKLRRSIHESQRELAKLDNAQRNLNVQLDCVRDLCAEKRHRQKEILAISLLWEEICDFEDWMHEQSQLMQKNITGRNSEECFKLLRRIRNFRQTYINSSTVHTCCLFRDLTFYVDCTPAVAALVTHDPPGSVKLSTMSQAKFMTNNKVSVCVGVCRLHSIVAQCRRLVQIHHSDSPHIAFWQDREVYVTLMERTLEMSHEVGHDWETLARLQRRHCAFERDIQSVQPQVDWVISAFEKLKVLYAGAWSARLKASKESLEAAWSQLNRQSEMRREILLEMSTCCSWLTMHKSLLFWVAKRAQQVYLQMQLSHTQAISIHKNRMNLLNKLLAAENGSGTPEETSVSQIFIPRDISEVHLLLAAHKNLRSEMEAREEVITMCIARGLSLYKRLVRSDRDLDYSQCQPMPKICPNLCPCKMEEQSKKRSSIELESISFFERDFTDVLSDLEQTDACRASAEQLDDSLTSTEPQSRQFLTSPIPDDEIKPIEPPKTSVKKSLMNLAKAWHYLWNDWHEREDRGETLEETLQLLKKQKAFELTTATQAKRFDVLKRLTQLEKVYFDDILSLPSKEYERRQRQTVKEGLREFLASHHLTELDQEDDDRDSSFTSRLSVASSVMASELTNNHPQEAFFGGLLNRKHEWERSGEKASNRSWKQLFVVLVPSLGKLMCYRNRFSFDPDNVLAGSYHNEPGLELIKGVTCVAAALEYRKRAHVFRVRNLVSGADFLFEASTEQSMMEWIEKSNAVIHRQEQPSPKMAPMIARSPILLSRLANFKKAFWQPASERIHRKSLGLKHSIAPSTSFAIGMATSVNLAPDTRARKVISASSSAFFERNYGTSPDDDLSD
ncbi:hypothetical protein Ciccas_011879 [Cichlidogyrus casuarinus]|uniref:PH domain-containing protein n=1 Tax=Cichlidogyrus casuarinus TaxID=1844966 RepID=A0ABD2PQH5_9PLAT